jgi:DNA (cytosine-5)-methyltransferase 1
LFLAGYQRDLVARPLVPKKPTNDLLDDAWRQAIDASDRLRPARLLAAMEQNEPETGWVTIGTGNPRPRSKALLEYIDIDEEQSWWPAPEIERHVQMMFQRHRRQVEALRLQSDAPTVLTAFRRVRQGRQRMEVRFDGVAGCLRTPRGGSAKQIVLAIDRGELRMRWMTPREYARLQGAGDFVLPANTIQGGFGFGDAVCVPVIEWIDRQMLTPVYEAANHRHADHCDEAEHARPVLAG